MTALDIEVPNDLASALIPLAAAVSEMGTAALMSAGNDEYAKPTPRLIAMLTTITATGLPSNQTAPR